MYASGPFSFNFTFFFPFVNHSVEVEAVQEKFIQKYMDMQEAFCHLCLAIEQASQSTFKSHHRSCLQAKVINRPLIVLLPC